MKITTVGIDLQNVFPGAYEAKADGGMIRLMGQGDCIGPVNLGNREEITVLKGGVHTEIDRRVFHDQLQTNACG